MGKWGTVGLISLLLFTACGGGATGAVKPTATPSPTAVASQTPLATPSNAPCTTSTPAGSPPLMAVLEAKRPTSRGGSVPPLDAHDTLAIAGLDAIARAHSTFQPRATPYIGNAATLLAPYEAYVVKGAVYFTDGFGEVWRMGADGKQVVVAKFLIGLVQQELSFAVSADGCRFAATVLTIPPEGPPPSGIPFPTLNGTWRLQTMSATAGGPSQVLHTWTSSSYPGAQSSTAFSNIVLVGWDSIGPIVVVGSSLGTQSGTYVDNPGFYGGTVAHLADDGMVTSPVTLPGCSAIQVSPAGDITCYATSTGQNISLSVIRSTGGTEVAPMGVPSPTDVAAGPAGLIALSGQWRGPTGAIGVLPANFHPEGWVDSSAIFGRLGDAFNGNGDAAIVHLAGSRATLDDLRFAGDFVGMLS